MVVVIVKVAAIGAGGVVKFTRVVLVRPESVLHNRRVRCRWWGVVCAILVLVAIFVDRRISLRFVRVTVPSSTLPR